ncbi:MAG: hypothetical protein LAN63_18210, partial [Acidobacteriia bacterium]|nr:hypothetical protein [Terriglobia bacterium]
LTVGSKGQVWVEVLGMGCSNGFDKVKINLPSSIGARTTIGRAQIQVYPMKLLIECAESMLGQDHMALACENKTCLSCQSVGR